MLSLKRVVLTTDRMQNGCLTTSDNINNNECAIGRTPTKCTFADDQHNPNMDKIEKTTFKVYLTNGNYNVVKTGDVTDVGGIVTLIASRLSSDSTKRFYENSYAIRLNRLGSRDDQKWLDADTPMNEALEEHQHLLDSDYR